MALEQIHQIKGRAVYLPGDDVDTDRITPARYLKAITFDELSDALFRDERYTPDGLEKPHPLNDPRFKAATIMLVGDNFGCGSSREHSPQAVYRSGFRAIIGQGYAEIFFGNSTNISLVCLKASKMDLETLAAAVELNPALELEIDLDTLTVRYGVSSFAVEMPPSAQKSLTSGHWDPIAGLLEAGDLLEAMDKKSARAGA